MAPVALPAGQSALAELQVKPVVAIEQYEAADIAEGHISIACCELGNLSQQLGRPLAYDPGTRTVPGDAEATRLLARAYRAPWVHPDPATV